MKVNSNPLYLLIDEQPEAFKKGFRIQPSNSLDNGPYYMLHFPLLPQNRINIDTYKLIAVDAHISIYEEDKKEMAHSAFHLTVNLIDNVEDEYCVHLFYTLSGDYLFYTFRDGENNFHELESKEELLNFGKKNIQTFLDTLSEQQQSYKKQYDRLTNKAHNLSRLAETHQSQKLLKKTLSNYKRSLCELIDFIESATLFNQNHLAGIGVYKSLLDNTQQKLASFESAPRGNVPVIAATPVSEELSLIGESKPMENKSHSMELDSLNNKINALSRNRKTRTSSLILQEYELYQKKLNILKKSDTNPSPKGSKKTNHNNTDDFISVLDKMRQLQEEINSYVLDILRNDDRYRAMQNSLGALIQICSLKTSALLQTAVEYNRESIFEYLVAQRKDLDVNGLIQNVDGASKSLLEIAYKKDYIEMCKLLLQHGADSNIKRDIGLTSLGLCVINNDFNLFKMILEHSTVPLKEAVKNALDVAVFLKRIRNTGSFIGEIIRYNDNHQLKTYIPEFMDAFSQLDNVLNPRQKAFVTPYNFFQSSMKNTKERREEHLPTTSKP
ncbi:hypothetical protein [Legionella rowbothamii]|uniref:hypothetical protein n=1 Tax=Legionella rowbothamii TaxID=96229 RepID=UPI001054F1A5|nr:hypothetical protein [Legionella rowbothamii]